MITLPFILLYVIFHAICMIVRGMDELSARRSSTEPTGAADFLRLLDRMRKNQFQPLYTGLPTHLRPFMRTVRSLYTATCEKYGCSERIFYHFLRELILSQQSVHLLCQCTAHQQSFVSLMQAVHYWQEWQIRRYDQWRPLSRSSQEVLAGELIDHLFRQYQTPQAVSCIW